MMMTFQSLLLAHAALIAPQSGPADLRIETYSLHPMLIGQDQGLRFATLPRERSKVVEEVTDREGLARISSGDLQDLTFALFELFPGLGEERGSFVSLTADDRLVVNGGDRAHELIGGALAGFERVIGHRAQVEVTVVTGPQGAFDGLPDGGAVPARALSEALAEAPVVASETFSLDLRCGSTGFLDMSGSQSVVRDYSVEIATGNAVFDPVVMELRTGTRIAARYLPLGEGGRLAMIFDRGLPVGEPRAVDLEMVTWMAAVDSAEGGMRVDVTPRIELQDMVTSALAFEVDLGPDSVGVARMGWSLGGHQLEHLILTRVVAEPLAAVETVEIGGKAFVMVNREAVEPTYVYAARPDLALLQNQNQMAWGEPLELVLQASSVGLEYEFLPKVGSTDWYEVGPWSFVGVDDPARADEVAAVVEALMRPRGEVVRVGAAFSEQIGGDDGWSARVEAPSLLDGQAFGIVTRSTPRVSDLDVEVATNNSIGEPIVTDFESGLAVGLVPRRFADGWVVGVRGELQIPAGAPRSVVLPKVPGGELESRAAFAVRVDQLVDVAPTGSARLGSSEHGFDVFVR